MIGQPSQADRLRAFAGWLQRWVAYIQDQADLAEKASPPGEDPHPAEAAPRAPAGAPPEHWQEAARSLGPPAHWLALFEEGSADLFAVPGEAGEAESEPPGPATWLEALQQGADDFLASAGAPELDGDAAGIRTPGGVREDPAAAQHTESSKIEAIAPASRREPGVEPRRPARGEEALEESRAEPGGTTKRIEPASQAFPVRGETASKEDAPAAQLEGLAQSQAVRVAYPGEHGDRRGNPPAAGRAPDEAGESAPRTPSAGQPRSPRAGSGVQTTPTAAQPSETQPAEVAKSHTGEAALPGDRGGVKPAARRSQDESNLKQAAPGERTGRISTQVTRIGAAGKPRPPAVALPSTAQETAGTAPSQAAAAPASGGAIHRARLRIAAPELPPALRPLAGQVREQAQVFSQPIISQPVELPPQAAHAAQESLPTAAPPTGGSPVSTPALRAAQELGELPASYSAAAELLPTSARLELPASTPQPEGAERLAEPPAPPYDFRQEPAPRSPEPNMPAQPLAAALSSPPPDWLWPALPDSWNEMPANVSSPRMTPSGLRLDPRRRRRLDQEQRGRSWNE